MTFIPGVGWAAKAALTATELAIDAAGKRKKRKKLKLQAGKSRSYQLRLSNQSTYRNSKQIDTYQANNKYAANYKFIDIKSNVPAKKIKVRPVNYDVRPLIKAIVKEQQKSIHSILNLIERTGKNNTNATVIRDFIKEQMREKL